MPLTGEVVSQHDVPRAEPSAAAIATHDLPYSEERHHKLAPRRWVEIVLVGGLGVADHEALHRDGIRPLVSGTRNIAGKRHVRLRNLQVLEMGLPVISGIDPDELQVALRLNRSLSG